MKSVRFHGRGGEGTVIAAELLADAAFKEGKWVQAFPHFGPERRGAPVTSYVRVADKPIRLRGPLYEPHYVVVLNPLLAESIDVAEGLQKTGLLLINGPGRRRRKELEGHKVVKVDATRIAVKLGLVVAGSAAVNTVMLGALSRATRIVSLDSLRQAIRERWSGDLGEKNAEAAMLGFMLLRGIDKAG
jgi:2-oxoacid:acceptor oxidoreductase gamma subunit (pyruvate/2-ketoisovalerate family)